MDPHNLAEKQSARSSTQHASLAPAYPWTPGQWKNCPWSAFLALVGALLATAAMIGIVIGANGQPISGWNVQPPVLLAVASAVANILTHYALTEGITVAWWVKSLKPGTRVADLHNVWAFGTSFWDALFAGRSMNLIAVAGLLVAISPINAPLLQRAVVVSRTSISAPVALTIPAALEFPDGYTGIITGRGHIVAVTTTNFSKVLRDYNSGRPLNSSNMGCSGTCKASMNAAGYSIDCAESSIPFDINPGGLGPNSTFSTQTYNAFNGTDIFSSNFTYDEFSDNEPTFAFTAIYKESAGCNGTLHVTKCSLKPATMKYHILITNDSIALDGSYGYEDDQLQQYTPPVQQLNRGPSTHGGLALALNLQYQAAAHLKFDGAVGYTTNVNGVSAIQFATAGMDDVGNCGTTWASPAKTMLDTARQLAFRVAITAANVSNATNVQQIHGTRVDDVSIYTSHFAYLGASLVFTLLAGIFVLPLFLGWWHLGRTVSFSPIEIAKAFDAPHLSNATANASGTQLVKEIGRTGVMYRCRENGDRGETMRMDSPRSARMVDNEVP